MSEPSDIAIAWMNEALAEAQKGRTSPNPRVGAIIVDEEGKLVAKGHHKAAGADHAEVDAIKNAGRSVEGMTLIVTLEPCNHQGRTPPCTDAIIEGRIGRVIFGCADPAPKVPGAVEKMRAAGIEVAEGVLETDAKRLIADFTKHQATGTPLVISKAAITLDGKMATRTGHSKWITQEEARTEAHRMRDDNDAILVGIETVLVDDPALTVRHVDGTDPLRVVLDTKLRTPVDSKVIQQASDGKTLVFHGDEVDKDRQLMLIGAGATLTALPVVGGRLSLEALLCKLGEQNVLRLLVEGGPSIHGAFFDAGLVNRVAVFIAPAILGDAQAPSFASGRGVDVMSEAQKLQHVQTRAIGQDLLITGDMVG